MDLQIVDFIIMLFNDRTVAVLLLNSNQYLKLQANQKTPASLFIKMTLPMPSETFIFLHFLTLSSPLVHLTDQKTAKVYTTVTLIGLCTQLFWKACRLLSKTPACAVHPVSLNIICETMSLDTASSYIESVPRDCRLCSRIHHCVISAPY